MALPKDGDFSKLLGKGENPNGFVSQTCNGTLIDGRGGDGYNERAYGRMADGARWNTDPRMETMPLSQPLPVVVRWQRGH
jgi:hypothetical protein